MTNNNIVKVALTGGPCAGKSSAMEYLTEKLNGMGINVVVAPEAATQIINEGVVPGTLSFQKIVFERQLALEDAANQEAANNNNTTVVLYDRALYNQLAYISELDFDSFLKEFNVENVDKRYDGVIHLVSASVGTNAYTTANNAARLESLEEAQIMEKKTRFASSHYDGTVVIDNSTNFEGKLERVLDSVLNIINRKEVNKAS